MSRTIRARCPAKVNLLLKVVGRRDDGFHELQTVFQAIELWDLLTIEVGSGLTLTCDDPALDCGGENLVLRAATALCPPGAGAAFHLEKRIPVQGGLGGGSSDAAAALLLCSKFWKLGMPAETLRDVAGRLGADVPFFLTGGTAVGRGRGDRIEALRALGPTPLLLGIPPFGVPTREVFARLPARLTLPVNSVSLPLFLGHKWREENDFAAWANDLQSVVFEDRPALADFRDALLIHGARAALLSGSGSTVFGGFEGEGDRDRAGVALGRLFPDWRLLPTRTVDAGAHLVD